MRTSSRIGLILLLCTAVSVPAYAEAADAGATAAPAPGNDQTATDIYKKLPKDRFGAVEYTITKNDMMLDNWLVELNSSANDIVNRRNSYAKQVSKFNDRKRSYLGIRVKFPTHSYNAHARVAPQYQLPAFDARGFPINYGLFDPDAKDVNPFPKGSGTDNAKDEKFTDNYTTYSAVPRVPGIKTFIDFNDYENIISSVAGYVNVRYLGDLASKASEVGYEEGMPVNGFPVDPDGTVDSKRMMQLTQTGYIFADKDETREKDAYSGPINEAMGKAPEPAKRGDVKTPTRQQVEEALGQIESIAAAGGNAALGSKISYNGVLHNAGAIKEIVARVAGRNFRNGIALRLRNQNEEISEYFLGYLDFTGWQYRRWVNPSYLPAEEAEAFRLPLYPADIPYIAFDSFVVYRNGTELGGDFVTYVDFVKLDYDLAVPPSQLQLVDGFIDIDDEGWWKILRERNSKKTDSLMRKFSADLDLRRQQLGRTVRRAEGVAPIETSGFTSRKEYNSGAAAAAAPGGNQ